MSGTRTSARSDSTPRRRQPMSEPITFAIIGTGWRAEFLIRMARAAPDRLAVAAVVARSDASAERIAGAWGVKTVRSLDDVVGRGVDFVVPAVPWPEMPGAIRELVADGTRVMAETPPAPDLDGLRSLWRDVGRSGLVQVG